MCYPAPSLPGCRLAGSPSHPRGYSSCPAAPPAEAATALAGWVAVLPAECRGLSSSVLLLLFPKCSPHPLSSFTGLLLWKMSLN